MSYKSVKDAAGELVCYGPNDGMYEPGIPAGCTLSIVEVLPPLPATPYRQLRAAAYPPIGDQLDALWKGGADEAAMLEAVLAVKAKYPKP